MQKWEYLILAFHLGKAKEGSINGHFTEHEFGLSTSESYPVIQFKHKLLKQLGDEGWRLVAERDSVYTFERPKSANSN